MTSTGNEEPLYERMGQHWFGLGNLRGRCWFIGMEPGGTENPAWPATWETRFRGAPVVDLHDSAGDAQRRWIGPGNVLHATWSPLIRCRLAYDALPSEDADVLAYQRDRFCRADGDEALLEVSSFAAPGMEADVPRERFREARAAHIGGLVAEHMPEIVVCYGVSYRAYYETICGGSFDANGFRERGPTTCAITIHPSPRFRRPMPPGYWTELGAALRMLRARGVRE